MCIRDRLFHKDDEIDEADTYSLAPQATPSGLSEEPTLVETATASLRAAVGLKPQGSLVINGKIKATDLQSSKKASFAGAAPLGAASIHAFTQGGVPAGTPRRASDAKAVPTHVLPSHFSIVSSFFEPHRDPTHQHYHQDIQARIVEVYYEAFVEDPDLDLLQQPKIRLPNGNRFRLPTEHFCEGVWCTATVDPNGYDEDKNTYTLIYHEGPFENRKGTVIKIAGFPQGTMFETVWIASTGLGGPHQTSELSISANSKSIWLIFGRIDCSRRVLEAQRKSPVQTVRLRAH